MSDTLPHLQLSRRESQAMDVLYRLGEASVGTVTSHMADKPGYNTVRNTLAILERKGYVRHRQEGKRYLYSPMTEESVAQRSAVRHMLRTFFADSSPRAVLAILSAADRRMTEEEVEEISRYIEAAREGAPRDD